MKKTLKVKEIFYSIQGEGKRTGEASIFIRLSNCNLNCHYCDTDWNTGTPMTLEEILKKVKQYKANWIVWTGGEPTLQLTDQIIGWFKYHGYKQAIETNGTNRIPGGIDYVACSPKVGLTKLQDTFTNSFVNEFRYPLSSGQKPPSLNDLWFAAPENLYVSPIFMGKEKERLDIDRENVLWCVDFVKRNPEWKLSMQVHKFIDIR